MITSFKNDDVDRNRGNKNKNEIPKGVVSIQLANCGDFCSNPNNDGSVVSFEYWKIDRRTRDDDDLAGAEAPNVNREFGNDNINENLITSDNDEGDDDDNTKVTDMSVDLEDDNSEG